MILTARFNPHVNRLLQNILYLKILLLATAFLTSVYSPPGPLRAGRLSGNCELVFFVEFSILLLFLLLLEEEFLLLFFGRLSLFLAIMNSFHNLVTFIMAKTG